MIRRSALVVPLSDSEVEELRRILVEGDEAGAMAFMDRHVKPAAHSVLDGS